MQMETLFPEYISVSRDLNTYSACSYKWLLQRCLRLSKYVYNTDLEAGGEFASAVEIIRTLYYNGGMSEENAVKMGVKHLLESYGATYTAEAFKDDLKTPEKMAEVLAEMFRENPMDASTIVPFEMLDGTLSVEQEFCVELPFTHPETGKPIVLRGILDLLGLRGTDVFGVDEKTCKSVLTDAIKQADLLRTNNQFVCYTCLANKNKEKFGDLELTHFRVNKCKVKKTYTKTENVVEGYEFLIDIWFQETWWNNMLYQVADMLEKYKKFKDVQAEVALRLDVVDSVIFPRAYGHSCTLFFRPCLFTYHCTSGTAQDLFSQGFKQIVSDKIGQEVTLHDWRNHILHGVDLPEVEVKNTAGEADTIDDFLGTF
jgi:hypothetical protein